MCGTSDGTARRTREKRRWPASDGTVEECGGAAAAIFGERKTEKRLIGKWKEMNFVASALKEIEWGVQSFKLFGRVN